MIRRDFLKFCAAALAPPSVLSAHHAFAADGVTASTPRYLVLIEFNGGNDGLNTVIPYSDSRYYDARPNIAIARDQVAHLDEKTGLHPALAPLMPLWQARQMSIIQAVGYPEPNRSHFRSIEIWDTGSDAEQYLDSGWLARALPHTTVTQNFTTDAIVIGRNPAAVTGGDMRALVATDINQFARRASKVSEVDVATRNPALAHLLDVQREVHGAANGLLSEAQNAPAPQASFPPSEFGRSMEQAARLILMAHATPVIKVALGSFDTHNNQRGRQDKLLGEFAAGVSAFQTAMSKAGLWNQVMMVTYSEFGRRVGENGSNGTDHGTAAPVFFLGGAVKGGLIGTSPSLTDLDAGDLKHQHDYRRVYNTILKKGWGLAQTPFDSTHYPPLELI